MARSFNGTSDTINATPPASVRPLTFSCWFNATSAATQQMLMELRASAAGTVLSLQVGFNGGDFCADDGTGASDTISDVSVTTGVWHHGAGVFTSTTTLQAFLDGVAASLVTTAAGVALTADQLYFGSNHGASLFFGGLITQPALWKVALSADEILALASGVDPRRVRGESLVGFWRLNSNGAFELDESGSWHNGTLTGTSFADDPPTLRHGPVEWLDRAINAVTVKFRKSLSGIGGKVGQRQLQG